MVAEEGKNSNDERYRPPSDRISQLEPSSKSRRYSEPGDATKELFEGFNAWCTTVSTHGIQTAYAVIAANWAVYGNTQTILENLWAKGSIAIIISFLGLNLLFTWLMTKFYIKRYEYADKNRAQWSSEFEAENIAPSAWPYTKFIEGFGEFMRLFKTFAPIVGGIVFILGLIFGG